MEKKGKTERADRPGKERVEASEGEGNAVCELCGGPVVELHCKIICLNCGYKRDCSDP